MGHLDSGPHSLCLKTPTPRDQSKSRPADAAIRPQLGSPCAVAIVGLGLRSQHCYDMLTYPSLNDGPLLRWTK